MATFESNFSQPLTYKVEKSLVYPSLEDFEDPVWAEAIKPSKNNPRFHCPRDSSGSLTSGYDSADDSTVNQTLPEVNLKNVASGLIAILTGRNKNTSTAQRKSSNPSFLRSGNNGEVDLHSSVYIPSAPPLLEPTDCSAYKEVLDAEPPEWVPDSASAECMQCAAPFTALTRGRHHCRFCGGVFCSACTKGRCLMPVKFRERNPQRVCDACYDRLDPLQGILIGTISNAKQVAKHDVTDWTCSRGWLNLPIGFSMEHEIYKASISLRNYSQIALSNPEKSIPFGILKGARGLAILTVAKAGALVSYKVGTGLVVARRVDGSWSAPSSICSVGLGWGAQIGGELMDIVVVLHDYKAVKTFCSRMHVSLGAGCSVAAGPVGRVAEADVRAGDRGSGVCYTYSCSKGAFIGVSLEGNVVATRAETNMKFYGDPYISTADILLGNVERPMAAQPLYSSLDRLYASLRP